MGGFLAALAGAGQAAVPYRDHILDKWQHSRDAIHEMLQNEIPNITDPVRKADALKSMIALQGLRPGDGKLEKVGQDALAHILVHQDDVQAMQNHGVIPPPSEPPPRAPNPALTGAMQLQTGNTQGKPSALTSLMSNPQDFFGGPPLAGGGGGSGTGSPASPQPQAQPQAPPQPPAAQPAASPIRDTGPIRPVDEFTRQYNSGYVMPMVQKLAEPQLNAQGQNQAELERQKGLAAYRQQAIEPYLSGLPAPMANLSRMQAITGQPMTGMMSTMYAAPTKLNVDTDGMSAEDKATHGIPPDAKGKWTVLSDRFGNHVGAEPGWAGTGVSTNAQGEQGIYDKNNPGAVRPLAAVGGGPAVAPSQTSLHYLPTAGGGVEAVSGAGIRHGADPLSVGGAVSPSMLPSVTQTGGDPATVHYKGGVRGGTGVSGSGGGGNSAPAIPPSAQYHVDRIKQGLETLQDVPAKEKSTVTAALERSGTQAPVVMSPAGQKAIASIDPVLQQVKDLKQYLDEHKLSEDDSHTTMLPDYLKYRTGFAAKNAPYFTNVSFERIRSAAAALQGMNSRAYPIIQEALQHTPDPRIHTPKAQYQRLSEMEDLLNKARSAVMADQRKSGVIQPISGSSSGASSRPPLSSFEK